MHKFLLLFICTFFSLSSFAQTTKIKIKKEKEEPIKPDFEGTAHELSIDLYYGNRAYNKSYYNQINAINQISLSTPPSFVGFGFSGYNLSVGRQANFKSQANYYKIIPARINIEDTLNTKLSGYVMGLGIGWGLSTENKMLGINGYIGFNTGRTTLSKNEYITLKNQFFSPKITIQPRFIYKHLTASIIVEAEYDITNPAWKQTIFERKSVYLLQPFHQTCVTGLVSIGYLFY